jgi:hypothetical protein
LLLRLGLLMTSCPTGKVEASKRMMKGGCDPGGNAAWIRLENALTSGEDQLFAFAEQLERDDVTGYSPPADPGE